MSHRFDCFVILPDPSLSLVLMQCTGSSWSLPHFIFREDHFGIVAHVGAALRERYGIYATVLRCAFYKSEPDEDRTHCVYVMEAHAASVCPLPPHTEWVVRETVSSLPLTHPEHRALLEEWRAEKERGNETPLRPAFTQPGFHDNAVRWMAAKLGDQRRRITGPIEQMRLWQRCCLLRAPTEGGDVYLKAVAGPFAHETGVTLSLHQQFPERVPTVLAADVNRGLLMTSDFAGQSLDSVESLANREQAVRQYASLQVALAGSTDHWLALGCPDRGLAVLSRQIQQRLGATGTGSLYETCHQDGLTCADRAALQAMAARWRADCDALANMGLPATLCHGDLCAGNVALTAGGPVFFDWSDASVAHPFFDLMWLLHGIEERLPDIPNVRDHLRDVYLEAWSPFGSPEHLRAAFALSQPLAALHHAFTYTEYILPNIEEDWEMADLVPFFLRMALPV